MGGINSFMNGTPATAATADTAGIAGTPSYGGAVGTGIGQIIANSMTQPGNNLISKPGDSSALLAILGQMNADGTAPTMETVLTNVLTSGLQQHLSSIIGAGGSGNANLDALLSSDLTGKISNNVMPALLNLLSTTANGGANLANDTKTQTVQQSTGGCFITTAICENVGLDDDCEELQVLRTWRDSFLKSTTSGEKLVQVYYTLSPMLAQRLRDCKRGQVISKQLFTLFILPAIQAIKAKDDELAFKLYIQLLETVIQVLAIEEGKDNG
jgi:hypothetical protein